MQGNVLGQVGGSSKINGIIEEYKVASGGNVNAGDFVRFVEARYNIYDNLTLSKNKVNAILLSENKIFLYSSTEYSSIYGTICIITNTEIITGTETLLVDSMGSITNNNYVTVLDENKFLITYVTSTSIAYTKICTISDTEITTHIETKISNNDIDSISKTLLLNENKIFIAYYGGSYRYLYGIVCTISNTEITIDTETQLDTMRSDSSAGRLPSINLLSENKIFIVCKPNSFSYGLICTISETETNVGTMTKLNDGNTSDNVKEVFLLNENKLIIIYEVSQKIYGIISNIADLEIIIESRNDLKIDTTGDILKILPLNNNKFAIIYYYSNSNNDVIGAIYLVSNTEILKKNETTLITNVCNFTGSVVTNNNSIIVVDNDKFIIAYKIKTSNSSTNPRYSVYFKEFLIFGTRIGVENTIALPTDSNSNGNAPMLILTNKNKVVMYYITERSSNVINNNALINVNEIDKINGTQLDIVGIAKTKGTEEQIIDVIVPN